MSVDGLSDPWIEVELDGAIHPLDAIQRAAYRMLSRCTVDVRKHDQDYVCRLRPKKALQQQEAGLADDFRAEVLDEILRARIRAETENVRNLILSVAFSETGLGDKD